MPGNGTRDEHSYQWRLRALGAYLDGQAVEQYSVLETPDGFAVRFAHEGEHELTLVEFDGAALATLDNMMQRRRGPDSPPGNGPHADTLRALGWELDDSRAADILIEGLGTGLLLTFLRPLDGSGEHWEKRSVNLDGTGIGAVLREAYARRRQPRHGNIPGTAGKLLG